MCKLIVFDRNTWNHWSMCKSLVLDSNCAKNDLLNGNNYLKPYNY